MLPLLFGMTFNSIVGLGAGDFLYRCTGRDSLMNWLWVGRLGIDVYDDLAWSGRDLF